MQDLRSELEKFFMMLGAIVPIILFWFTMATIGSVFLFYLALWIFPPATLIAFPVAWLYCGKSALKNIRKFNNKNVKGTNKKHLKQRYRPYHKPEQSLTAIENLPTDESLQNLIDHDGEIPDEAFSNQD